MTDPAAGAPAPAKASLAEDLFDIWFTPSRVFTRRAGQSGWGAFLVVSVLLLVLFLAVNGMMQGVWDAEMARAVAQAQQGNPNMTGDQIAGMQKVMAVSMKYGAMVGIPIALLLMGLLVWIVGKVLGGALGFGSAVMIASFAYVPKVLEMLLIAVQGLFMDTASWTSRFQFSWGVGRFMDHSGPQGMLNFVGRIDVFTIWVTLLIALGFMHAAKIEKSKAYIGAAVMWVLGAAPALLQIVQGK